MTGSIIGPQLRQWLSNRFPTALPPQQDGFTKFMQAMIEADSASYQAMQSEALAWLRWLRQLAAARQQEA